VEFGYLHPYADGWSLTAAGIEHLLETDEPDPDDHNPGSELAHRGLTVPQIDELRRSHHAHVPPRGA
jgi:hypothetical protein